MSRLPHQPDYPRSVELPDGLTRDLRSLYERNLRVPESIDASILREARAGFARRRRFRLALRGALVASGAAAAALVVVAVRIAGSDGDPTPSPMAQHQPAPNASASAQAVATRPEDIDHSGRVDILDAFVVARLIDVQDHLDQPAYDVNGDGKVDRADVDRIAMAAVDTTSANREDGRVQ